MNVIRRLLALLFGRRDMEQEVIRWTDFSAGDYGPFVGRHVRWG